MVDTGIPSSFIPHDTAVAPTTRRSGGGGLNDLLLLCAIVLFVASAALAVGVFLYGQYITSESASKLTQLEHAKEAFQPALIQQLTRLDDRMHAADKVLSSHIAPSLFFRALEEATLQTVSFQTLNFEVSDQQHLVVKMTGIAQSVNSIALQADLFSKNGVVTSPIFSNIARQSDGVHFNLSALINPAAVNYMTHLGSTAAAQGGGSEQQGTEPTDATPFGDLRQNQGAGGQPAAPVATTSATSSQR